MRPRYLTALLDYEQADQDGVMVLVSRQAIHETINSHDSLVGLLEDCAARFRAALIEAGTDVEYADIAVEEYRTGLALAKGEKP